VIVPHLISIAGLLVLTTMLAYHLFAIDSARIISASLTVFVIFLLSLRGTLRYKRKSSIWLTTFLFFCFAITFLFFDRTKVQAFSWVGITLFAIAIAIWTAAAVRTFREPRAEDLVPTSSAPLDTTEQG
jgi:peptidoglycan/LPS O-acetylase OafA/YrhL